MDLLLELVVRVLAFLMQCVAILGEVLFGILRHFFAPKVSEGRSTLASFAATVVSVVAMWLAWSVASRAGAPQHLHWAASFLVAGPIIAAITHRAMHVPWRASAIIAVLFHAFFVAAAFGVSRLF